MQIYSNILETIGNTPIVKLNKITAHIPATICVKVEYGNPGNSIKDRMALKMVEDAEKMEDYNQVELLSNVLLATPEWVWLLLLA
jgi:cysteine synthase